MAGTESGGAEGTTGPLSLRETGAFPSPTTPAPSPLPGNPPVVPRWGAVPSIETGQRHGMVSGRPETSCNTPQNSTAARTASRSSNCSSRRPQEGLAPRRSPDSSPVSAAPSIRPNTPWQRRGDSSTRNDSSNGSSGPSQHGPESPPSAAAGPIALHSKVVRTSSPQAISRRGANCVRTAFHNGPTRGRGRGGVSFTAHSPSGKHPTELRTGGCLREPASALRGLERGTWLGNSCNGQRRQTAGQFDAPVINRGCGPSLRRGTCSWSTRAGRTVRARAACRC